MKEKEITRALFNSLNESADADVNYKFMTKAQLADWIYGVASYIANVLDTDGYGVESRRTTDFCYIGEQLVKVSVATGFAGESINPKLIKDLNYDIAVFMFFDEDDDEDNIDFIDLDFRNDGSIADKNRVHKVVNKIFKAVNKIAKQTKRKKQIILK